MQRRPDIYLELALLALRKIPRFMQRHPTVAAYRADDYCQSAVERQLEIAGDALVQLRKHCPDVFERIPDGPLIVAFRNVLAHGYATLDHDKVFEAATQKAPALAVALQQLLVSFPER